MKLLTYYHTLKYLKFSQLYQRILKKISHPKVHCVQGIPSDILGSWFTQELFTQKLLNDTEVYFLNHKGKVSDPASWNSREQEKLWLYNLHYFDDLNSFDSIQRRDLQLYWINKWIDENPARERGNGWEAYTLSLRIVNWVKASLSGLGFDQKQLDSLAQQADFLSQDLEKHLLGNHYFVNLKALFFAGCFLQGDDADFWLAIALKDYEKELNEQVLNDGGSFELTPMYHAIMLTDLLDLVNLFNAFPKRVSEKVVEHTNKTIIKMFGWLDKMSHGDDKGSFFNDSVFGIAPTNLILRDYATKLGFKLERLVIDEDKLCIYNLLHTGYVSVKSKELSLIADLAPVGPSYIPGHAHADSLSFELSLGIHRVFVNSGTSLYGVSPERLRQRGTGAHNTVVINSVDSSEVWSGFRVARRADIVSRRIGSVTEEQTVEFSAAHNGYKKQGISCIHNRTWKVALGNCTVLDVLQGNYGSAVGFLHLHPEVKIVSSSDKSCLLQTKNHEIQLKVDGAKLSVENSTWHPEFGVVLRSHKICLQYLHTHVSYKISWITI